MKTTLKLIAALLALSALAGARAANPPAASFEVIVIDDGSPEADAADPSATGNAVAVCRRAPSYCQCPISGRTACITSLEACFLPHLLRRA